jgi:hypothetical protein
MYSTNTSRQQFLRDVLTLAKQRISSTVTNDTNTTTVMASVSSLYTSDLEIVLRVGYIFIIYMIIFLIKTLLRTVHNFEYYYRSSLSYNRFGFIANEESQSESELESATEDDDDNEDITDVDVKSLPSSPILLRPILCSLDQKYLHLQTPVQTMSVTTPKTPLPPPPPRRSLRLKIKSELNLSAIETKDQYNNTIMTRSQTKQNKAKAITPTISSDPCPISKNRSSIMMTTPSPHPEHDEERAYYIRYCNEKKMRKKRPEFNSPIFIRRLVL